MGFPLLIPLVIRLSLRGGRVEPAIAEANVAAARACARARARARARVRAEARQLDDLVVVASREGIPDGLPWNLGERVSAGSPVVVLLAGELP